MPTLQSQYPGGSHRWRAAKEVPEPLKARSCRRNPLVWWFWRGITHWWKFWQAWGSAVQVLIGDRKSYRGGDCFRWRGRWWATCCHNYNWLAPSTSTAFSSVLHVQTLAMPEAGPLWNQNEKRCVWDVSCREFERPSCGWGPGQSQRLPWLWGSQGC